MAMNCAEIYKVKYLLIFKQGWCVTFTKSCSWYTDAVSIHLSIMVKCISMMLWKVCYIYLCVWTTKALYFHLNTSLKKAPYFYKYCGSQSSFIAGYNLKKIGTQQESIKVKRNVISISSYLIIETATKSC